MAIDRAFTGFSSDSLAFFAGLEADNSKEFWLAHRAVWEERVHAPFAAFAAALSAESVPLRIFRPHRDVRFSKDKSPYKTQIGASGARPGGSIHYVQLSAQGLLAATGLYTMAPVQLERFRAAVADGLTGAGFQRIVDRLAAEGLPVAPGGEPPLKTAPRGYPKDHPRVEHLRWKGATVGRDFGTPSWLASADAVERVAAVFRGAEPLNDWLDRHVGPSTEPRDRAGRL